MLVSVVSILSERRAFEPYGMAGGRPGARGTERSSHNHILVHILLLLLLLLFYDNALYLNQGSNLLSLHSDGSNRIVNLGGKNTVEVSAGDRLLILTPGGGGYGDGDQQPSSQTERREEMSSGSLFSYAMNQITA